MTGKGAPQGNQNAKKETTGRRLIVYLTADELSLLRYVLEKYGHDDVSDAACLDLARKAAKAGINNLLNPEYYETTTKRVLNVAVYDPKLQKYVVSVSHNPDYTVGDLID